VPVDLKAPVFAMLRALRTAQGRLAGGFVAACPVLEPSFIAIGRAATRRSRLAGTLYWSAETELIRRLATSERRFRRLRVAGVDVMADITDGSARLDYFHGEPYEAGLVNALPGLLTPGSVFVDVGANVGFLSILAARLVGAEGRVAAFEPHPGAVERLRAGLAVNGVDGTVEVIEAACGAHDQGTVRLHLAADSVLSTTDPNRAPLGDFPFLQSIDVASITIDGWMRGRPELLGRIAAIKIDVEGTEEDVLCGMAETLTACPRAVLICETVAGGPADRWLRARGYEATLLDERRHAFGNYLYSRRSLTMC
jgi:FkbM family methyltransferase